MYLRTMGATIVALAVVAGVARAENEGCREFRENMLRMEASSLRPPGWYKLDHYLRLRYALNCAQGVQERAPEKEWWYRSDGTNTGHPADGPRPDDGAYAATEEIASQCAGAGPASSTCALMRRAEKSCRDPGPHSDKVCNILFGKNRERDDGMDPDPTADLPDLTVTLDGRDYKVPPACADVLRKLEDNDPDGLTGLLKLKQHCPELLEALQRRAPTNDPSQFWQALQQLAQSGFAPPGASPMGPASTLNDPGYRRMCEQAKANMETCDRRAKQYQGNLQPDADKFAECRKLYGMVYAMCGNTQLASLPAPRPTLTAPPARPPQPPKTPQAKTPEPTKPGPGQKATPVPGPSQPPPSGKVVDCGGGYSCPEGNKCTRDRRCVPANAVACSNGKFCPQGAACQPDGSCGVKPQPGQAVPGFFWTGSGWCPNGWRRGAQGRCIAPGRIDCGNGTSCRSGETCTEGNKCEGGPSPTGPSCGDAQCHAGEVCLSSGSVCYDPRRHKICSDGHGCPIGMECIPGGCTIGVRRVQPIVPQPARAREP